MPNSRFYKLRNMGNRGSRESRKVQNITEKGHVSIMKTGKSFEIQNPCNEPSQNQDHISSRRSYYIPSRNRVEKLLYCPTHTKATDTHKTLPKSSNKKKKSHKKSLSTYDKLIPSSVSSVNTCQEQGSSVLSSEPTHETRLRHLNGVLTDQLNTADYIHSISLPPIETKPIKKDINKPNLALRNQSSKQGGLSSHGIMRKPSTPQTPRIKIRLNSSKLGKKTLREKKGLADSFVVVKLSSDPQRDFRDSMLEMIVQENLWASKDLEELLSCYLYLNSDEYQDLIVKAFKQIWFDLTVLNLKYK